MIGAGRGSPDGVVAPPAVWVAATGPWTTTGGGEGPKAPGFRNNGVVELAWTTLAPSPILFVRKKKGRYIASPTMSRVNTKISDLIKLGVTFGLVRLRVLAVVAMLEMEGGGGGLTEGRLRTSHTLIGN